MLLLKQVPLLLLPPQVAEHCSEQGMQFLLAVRGCSQDNAVYTPVIPLNVQCNQLAQQGPGLGAGAGAAGAGALGGNALGLSALPGLSDAPKAQDKADKRRKGNSAAAASGSFLAAAAAGLAAAALL